MPESENSLPKGFWAKQIISINPAELNIIAFVSVMDEMPIVSAFPSLEFGCFDSRIFWSFVHTDSHKIA